jgi:hypothetical protein
MRISKSIPLSDNACISLNIETPIDIETPQLSAAKFSMQHQGGIQG